MAERSAEERIRLWYEQYTHALQSARMDFAYSHPMYHNTLKAAQERFRQAVDITAYRADYLRDNPAEAVQDRLDASRERAEAAMRTARYEPPEMTPAERRMEEAQDRLSDPEYQGQMAEEYFYEEYGDEEDALDNGVYYEPTRAEQDAYEAAPYDRMEDEAHEEVVTQHPWMAHVPERIEIDASDTDTDPRWEDQLAELDKRLNAAIDREAQAQTQTPHQGMRY